MNAEIKNYSSDDQDALLRFFQSAFEQFGVQLHLEGIHNDLLNIAKVYRRDGGEFFILWIDGEIGGSVAVRRIPHNIAELKRLYLLKQYHGHGYGRKLVQCAIDQAQRSGFKSLRLDTSRRFPDAIRLFHKMGFQPIVRYNDNPHAEFYYELELPVQTSP